MGTHYKGSKSAVRALDVYIKVVRAAESLLARVHRDSPGGLTISQFGVLEALYHLGPMHQRKIGTKLLKSGGNVTMVIDNLERRKLVQRRRDQKDRRFVRIHLTSAGEKLIKEIFPQRVKVLEKEMRCLAIEEQTELARLCKILGLQREQPQTKSARS